MSKFRILLALAGAALIAALLGGVPPAYATVPGANGRIAFTDFTFGGTDNVFTMTQAGLNVKQLTFLTSDQGGDGQAAWSPDGSTLVFTEHSCDQRRAGQSQQNSELAHGVSFQVARPG